MVILGVSFLIGLIGVSYLRAGIKAADRREMRKWWNEK